MIIPNVNVEDELKHYGVLGMKWGVRKDRNRVKVNKQKVGTSKDYKRAQQIRKKKKAPRMSNSELQIVIKRMELEKKYSELNPPLDKKINNANKRGAAFVGGFVASAGAIGSAYAFTKTPAGQAVVKGIRAAFRK